MSHILLNSMKFWVMVWSMRGTIFQNLHAYASEQSVSSFARIGNLKAWKAWMALRKEDKVFSNYCTASVVLPSESDLYFDLLQRFVTVMYVQRKGWTMQGIFSTLNMTEWRKIFRPRATFFSITSREQFCNAMYPRTIWTVTESMFMGLEKMWITIRNFVAFKPWWREIGKIIEFDCL